MNAMQWNVCMNDRLEWEYVAVAFGMILCCCSNACELYEDNKKT